jgi:anti-sigma regulatory factor (Ser/Thr protein kinase)
MEVIGSHRRVAVVERSQPSEARYAAHAAAEASGFGEEDIHRAGIVATELATNLVHHAVSGEMLIRSVRPGPVGEIELIAIDRGPGIAELSRSLADGHSTAGTSGTGLGAVQRLADAFDVYTQRGRGTAILVRLRARRARVDNVAAFEVTGVSVAKNGETVCGDSWQAHLGSGGALVVLADGLGHGLTANEASTAAIASIDPRKDGDLAAHLQSAHDGLRHTRGAAVAIARITHSPQLVKYAGIGNVSGTIYRPGVVRHTVSLNGTLGHEARVFREYSYPWDRDSLFVMYSDGLGSHWSLDNYPGLWRRHPALVAAVLYRDFSRQRDDVTVVVGREAV